MYRFSKIISLSDLVDVLKLLFNIHGRCSTTLRFWPLRNERRRLWKCTFDRETIGVALIRQNGVVPKGPRLLGLLFLWRAWKSKIIVEIVMILFFFAFVTFFDNNFQIMIWWVSEKKNNELFCPGQNSGVWFFILPTAALFHLATKR